MPRRMIGSFSTKHADGIRNDIQMISVEPDIFVPPTRLSLSCDEIFQGQVIVERWHPIPGEWVAQQGDLPLQLFDFGRLEHPHPAAPIDPAITTDGNACIPTRWDHHLQLEITVPHLRFSYPRENNPPLVFMHLVFTPQVQQALSAEW
jgi:hypothetical protein